MLDSEKFPSSFLKWLCYCTSPPAMSKSASCSKSFLTNIASLLNFSHSNEYKVASHCVLICISKMTYEIGIFPCAYWLLVFFLKCLKFCPFLLSVSLFCYLFVGVSIYANESFLSYVCYKYSSSWWFAYSFLMNFAF